MPSRAKNLTDYAVGLLARRDYSAALLRRKLVEKRMKSGPGAENESIEAVIEAMIDKGYLSDERYRDAWVSAHRDRYGSAKIAAELAARGIDRALISAIRPALVEGDFAAACRVWRQKFGEVPVDKAERDRQARFLGSRGFSFSTIDRLFREVASNEAFGEADFTDD